MRFPNANLDEKLSPVWHALLSPYPVLRDFGLISPRESPGAVVRRQGPKIREDGTEREKEKKVHPPEKKYIRQKKVH